MVMQGGIWQAASWAGGTLLIGGLSRGMRDAGGCGLPPVAAIRGGMLVA